MKRFLLSVLVVASIFCMGLPAEAWQSKSVPEYAHGIWFWSETGKYWVPAYSDASGSLIVTGTMTTTLSTITASLATGSNHVGSVNASITAALPTGTNTIGSIGAIVNPLPAGTNTLGSITVITLPALPAGSNVIGTVVASITPMATGTSATLNTSSVATDIIPTTGRAGVFIQNISTESVWIQPWSNVASPTFSNSSYVLLQYDTIWFPYGEEIAIGHVSSTPGIIKVDQPVRR